MAQEKEVDPVADEDSEVEVTERPVFEVESIALHYTRAVGDYTQTTAARHARLCFVVETAIHFCEAGAP